MMKLPAHIQLREVGPRDGLQNEAKPVPTADKIRWIDQLAAAGHTYIEATSFVSPRWIPQLADAAAVMSGIARRPGVTYAALIPNMKGLQHALAAGIDEAAVFLSVSETHNRSNVNKSVAETLHELRAVAEGALQAGRTVRGYISTVFGCPFEGAVPLTDVCRLIEAYLEMGVSEVSLGDTIGVANPKQVETVLAYLLARYPADVLALHFHDTRGMALANVLVSMEMGITRFDVSAGGLGGCPYAPGASGNLASEDLVNCLHAMGVTTGVDLEQLLAAAAYIQEKAERPYPASHMLASWTPAEAVPRRV